MSLGTWDPKADPTDNTSLLQPTLLRQLIEYDKEDQLAQLERLLDEADKQRLAGLMHLDHKEWRDAAVSLSKEDLLHLIRFFAVAENLPGWEAGADSPVIPWQRCYVSEASAWINGCCSGCERSATTAICPTARCKRWFHFTLYRRRPSAQRSPESGISPSIAHKAYHTPALWPGRNPIPARRLEQPPGTIWTDNSGRNPPGSSARYSERLYEYQDVPASGEIRRFNFVRIGHTISTPFIASTDQTGMYSPPLTSRAAPVTTCA